MQEFSWDIFIAHAGADSKAAERLYNYLSPGAKVFLDFKSLILGDNWDIELPKAQKNSLMTVVLISKKTGDAYYQREEIAAANSLSIISGNNHRVIPLFLDNLGKDYENIPYGLRLKHGINITPKLTLKAAAASLVNTLSILKQYRDGRLQAIPLSTANNKPSSGSNEISANVSVFNHDEDENDFFDEDEKKLTYLVAKDGDKIIINRNLPYLSKFGQGGPITEISYSWHPFEWDFPNLDIKIVNNSDETIFLNEAVFEIASSRPDPFPLLLIKSDTYSRNAGHFQLLNDGWGVAEGLKARFHLFPTENVLEENLPDAYPYEIELGDLTEHLNVDVTGALKKEGVDFDGLDKLNEGLTGFSGNEMNYTFDDGTTKNMPATEYDDKFTSLLGPFKNNTAVIKGELEFKAATLTGEATFHKVKFKATVYVTNEKRCGLPAPPTYQYKIKFLVDGKNYERRLPISQVLKAGEADRINIKIGMDQSSEHIFNIKLLYNNGFEIETSEIVLTTFVSRAGMKYLRDKSTKGKESNH